jgi:hypothetical protein
MNAPVELLLLRLPLLSLRVRRKCLTLVLQIRGRLWLFIALLVTFA